MALFDIHDEIQLIDRSIDDWNVESEPFFYGIRACGMLSAIIEAFEAEKIEKGCLIIGYGRYGIHEFVIRGGQLLIGSQAVSDRHDNPISHFSVGPADNPASWEATIRHVVKAERAILQMVDFKGRVRREWDEYLRIRGDRLGF